MKNRLVKYGAWAGAVTAIIIMGATINEYRFWASASEFENAIAKIQTVGGVSYGTALARQDDKLISVELLIAECMAKSDCSRAQLENLKQQKARIEAKIEKLKADEGKL